MSRQPLTPSRPDREFPDATDVAIIRTLQADGRLPFVRVAELAGVSERTVRRKFHRLVADGALRVVAVANPLTMGFTCPAIMGIQCELTRVEEVVRALCALRQLRFVSLTTGRHDILVEGYFPTHDDLYAFRSGVLHRIDGVVSSQVAIVLRIDKQIYLWNLQRDDSPAPVPLTPEPLALAGPEYRARLTDLDRAIIECLQRDGRIPYADLAARVGVSQVTAARRVEQLLQDGVIRVVAVVNPYRVGLNCPAILGVNVDLQRQPEVMRALCRHPRLTYVAATTGEFDAVVVGYFADNQDLARFVVRDLARVPGVRRVNTSVLFDIPKHSYDWGSVAPPAHSAQPVPPAHR